MATMNVSLPDPMKTWVERQAVDGQYSNASDYVRHLIRKDQERQQALAQLQSAITEGLESGEAAPQPNPGEFKASMRALRAS